jgi:hypothetical protein
MLKGCLLFSWLSLATALQGQEETAVPTDPTPAPSSTIVVPAEASAAAPLDPPGYDGKPVDPSLPVTVKILSPKPEEVLQKSTVDVFFNVENYMLARGGNRLHVLVNNNPPVIIDNVKRPLVLKELPEGGHTIRVLAVRPDGLSLPEPEAFAQVHFFVRKKNFLNFTNPGLPYLTVNLPHDGLLDIGEGERIWLDFKTHNAPLAPGGDYAVKYKINNAEGIAHENRAVYWESLKPGRYHLTVELTTRDGTAIPGSFNFVKRAFQVRVAPKAEFAAPPSSGEAENVVPAMPASPNADLPENAP